MRRFTSAAFAVAAAAGLATGCKPPTSVVVTPTTDLLDGQEVSVIASGLDRNATYILHQCEVGRELFEGCQPDPLATVTTDGIGAFSTTLFVESTFTDRSGGFVDCREPVACVLVMPNPQLTANLVIEHIEFSGRDGLIVTPDRDLTDGQTVRVFGEFVGGGNKVMQCPSGVADYTACDMRTLQYVDYNGNHAFEVGMTVFATIRDDQGRTTDCTVPGACMVISDLNHGWSVTFPQWHPLEFD